MKYYYDVNGKTRGPVTLDELRNLLEDRHLSYASLVCGEGWAQWVPLADLRDMLPAPPRPVQQVIEIQAATPAPRAAPEAAKTGPIATGCALLAGLFGFALIMSSCHFACQSDRQNAADAVRRNAETAQSDAYNLAKEYLLQQIPGARSVHSIEESVISPAPDGYDVAIMVDGLNGFGGPVRNAVIVHVVKTGDTLTATGYTSR